MRPLNPRFCWAILFLSVFVSVFVSKIVGPTQCALADDVAELKNGGTLSGEITPYAKGSGKGQLIQMSPALALAIPEVEFRRVREDDENIAEYSRRLSELPDTAAAHWEMSQWCNGQHLNEQNERHLRRTIELDPNHGPARQLLGYAPNGNSWVKDSAQRRERGMLRDEGKWRLAEDVIVLRAVEDNDKARKEWVRTLARWKKQAAKGGQAGQDAVQELQRIDDPRADLAVVEQFTKGEDINRFPRLMWLEVLGRLKTSAAMNAIVEAAMNDRSASVQERCIELLNEHGKYQAIPYYLSKLSDPDNAVVNRAGRVLQELNDPEIALALVDAIWTKHETITAPGNDTNIAMSNDGNQQGGGGLQTGGKPTKTTYFIKNPEVLAALLEVVEEDVNYQYDKERWRLYFASKLAPPPGDLRRDP